MSKEERAEQLMAEGPIKLVQRVMELEDKCDAYVFALRWISSHPQPPMKPHSADLSAYARLYLPDEAEIQAMFDRRAGE